MKFEEILPYIRAGKKVRRPFWPQGLYIYRKWDDILTWCGDTYYLGITDLNVCDWELHEEPTIDYITGCDALIALGNGHKLRKEAWPPGKNVYIESGEIRGKYFYSNDASIVYILNNEWEIV